MKAATAPETTYLLHSPSVAESNSFLHAGRAKPAEYAVADTADLGLEVTAFRPLKARELDHRTPVISLRSANPDPAAADVQRRQQTRDGEQRPSENELLPGVAPHLEVDPRHIAVEGHAAIPVGQFYGVADREGRPERIAVGV